MRVFVDSSALIALLDEDDERHSGAVATFQSLVGSGAELITHNYVHVEAVAVADRRLGRDAGRKLIDAFFPAMSTIWVDETVHGTALVSHASMGHRISLVDRVSFVVMEQGGIQRAFAFDADFRERGFLPPPVTRESQQGRRLSEQPAPYGPSDSAAADLVSVSEIAERAGRPINTVQSWRRRHRDFPLPVARLAAGPIWDWPAVAHWIEATRRAQPARGGV